MWIHTTPGTALGWNYKSHAKLATNNHKCLKMRFASFIALLGWDLLCTDGECPSPHLYHARAQFQGATEYEITKIARLDVLSTNKSLDAAFS
jgi:hypothetical protein